MNSTASMKQVKVVILGESGVGKSSIMLRFITGNFQEDSEPTLGGAFMAKTYSYKNQSLKYQIWDTAGQEKYHSLAPMYYRDSQVALLVYDVTKRDSLQSLTKWVDELKENGPKELMIVVVGNKTDLLDQEQVKASEGAAFAKDLGALFKLTSAKMDTGIHDLFDKISEEMLKRAGDEVRTRGKTISKKEGDGESGGGWCC